MESRRFETPFGVFTLDRRPVDRTGTLRAWDGADRLLLERLAALQLHPAARVVVVGDRFGALTVPLSGYETWTVVDTATARLAFSSNAATNHGVIERAVSVVTELDGRFEGSVDAVVWNVDRSTSVVESVVSQIAGLLHDDSVVLAAGMDKHLPPRTGEILRTLGDLTTHHGRYKAHLFEVRSPFRSPVPPTQPSYEIEESGLVVTGLPGVFSADRFDVGARGLAAALDERDDAPELVVDLGCGSGVLGLLALRRWSASRVDFVDDSSVALRCAMGNVESNVGAEGLARSNFMQSDVFDSVPSSEPDLILCNPPFHVANALGDDVAWKMFVQSRERLVAGGELWVVGNRHLGYHAKLRRLFGNSKVRPLQEHPKFVVLAARA